MRLGERPTSQRYLRTAITVLHDAPEPARWNATAKFGVLAADTRTPRSNVWVIARVGAGSPRPLIAAGDALEVRNVRRPRLGSRHSHQHRLTTPRTLKCPDTGIARNTPMVQSVVLRGTSADCATPGGAGAWREEVLHPEAAWRAQAFIERGAGPGRRPAGPSSMVSAGVSWRRRGSVRTAATVVPPAACRIPGGQVVCRREAADRARGLKDLAARPGNPGEGGKQRGETTSGRQQSGGPIPGGSPERTGLLLS